MIFLVWIEDHDSPSGVSITGIYDNRRDASNFADSEGPDYKVAETSFGPIEWNAFGPKIDWNGF